MKSMSGVNDGCQFLDSMAQIDKRFDRVLTSNTVNVPVLRRDIGKIKVSFSDKSLPGIERTKIASGRL
eukprot:1161730-Pelagomonas_calceolata.AAC.2